MSSKRAHFIGIGGVGMSATALLLRDLGWQISGSDEGAYPPISTFLTQNGLSWNEHYAAENIPGDADMIVIGKNAKLVPETNAEVAKAYESGIPVRSFPEVIAELTEAKETVVVAGSYGKSTCAAIIAHCLEAAGKDPSFFIGAVPHTPKTSAKMTASDLFVLEGDEYPSSNTDPRSKFLHYRPAHLLITPLAHDHVNVFPTTESYLAPFYELVGSLPKTGTLVVAATGALSREFIEHLERQAVTYGLSYGDYSATGIKWDGTTTFTLRTPAGDAIPLKTTMLGAHNVENIVGAAALILSRGLLTPEELQRGVETFKGVTRRLDRKHSESRIPIFEGFGSSYEKARAAIDAMKLHFPDKRLVVVFEPHTFSWRNRDALAWYDDVFEGTEKIFVYEPATQGATTHKQLTQREIVERVVAAGCDAVPISDPKQALQTIGESLSENDVVLLLTSGDLGGLIEAVPRLAEQRFPA